VAEVNLRIGRFGPGEGTLRQYNASKVRFWPEADIRVHRQQVSF
jgi:hypothetical protein